MFHDRAVNHRARVLARTCCWLVLGGLMLLAQAGCGPLAAVSVVIVNPVYTGFPKQTTGIMVWADSVITQDFESIEDDVANGLYARIKGEIPDKDEYKEMKLISASKSMQFRKDHPEMSSQTATEWARAFNQKTHITRFIYIEVISMTTHPVVSLDLLKGTAVVNVYVVELDGDKARIGYRDRVVATFPGRGSPEGEMNVSMPVIYAGTLKVLTEEIDNKFVAHKQTRDEKAAVMQ